MNEESQYIELNRRIITVVNNHMRVYGIGQRAMANVLGMTQSHLSKVLRGQVKFRLAVIDRLEDAEIVEVTVIPRDH